MIVTDLPLATGHGDVDETAGVSESLLGAALGGLLLLLGLNLFQCVSLHPQIAVRIVAVYNVVVGRLSRRGIVLRRVDGAWGSNVLTLATGC
jgi:hypothetical protein